MSTETDTLGERLRVAFDRAHTSAPAVAKATGIKVASINALLRRGSSRSGFVEQILSALPPGAVNADWVRTGWGSPDPGTAEGSAEKGAVTPPPKPQGKQDARLPTHIVASARIGDLARRQIVNTWEMRDRLPAGIEWVTIPRLAVSTSGSTSSADSSNVSLAFLVEDAQLQNAIWIREANLTPDALGWAVQTDDSMDPVISAGDIYVIDSADIEIKDGKTYAIWYGDELRPRRLFKLPGGNIRVSPRNEQYESFDVPQSSLIIVGRVVRKAGGGGL